MQPTNPLEYEHMDEGKPFKAKVSHVDPKKLAAASSKRLSAMLGDWPGRLC